MKVCYSRKIKNLLRHIGHYNEVENEILTDEFHERIMQLKEQNSKMVFDMYYMPRAITAILREGGYLTTEQTAKTRAISMMLHDLSCGVLDEFYRFK